jgi:hypothetical protein
MVRRVYGSVRSTAPLAAGIIAVVGGEAKFDSLYGCISIFWQAFTTGRHRDAAPTKFGGPAEGPHARLGRQTRLKNELHPRSVDGMEIGSGGFIDLPHSFPPWSAEFTGAALAA